MFLKILCEPYGGANFDTILGKNSVGAWVFVVPGMVFEKCLFYLFFDPMT